MKNKSLIYPTFEEIDQASQKQLCCWWESLPMAATNTDAKKQALITNRFLRGGGYLASVSIQPGWDYICSLRDRG